MGKTVHCMDVTNALFFLYWRSPPTADQGSITVWHSFAKKTTVLPTRGRSVPAIATGVDLRHGCCCLPPPLVPRPPPPRGPTLAWAICGVVAGLLTLGLLGWWFVRRGQRDNAAAPKSASEPFWAGRPCWEAGGGEKC